MKKLSIYFIFALSSWTTFGQTQSTTSTPAPTPYSIISRSANSRVWERTTYELSLSGKVVPHLHHYTELASGLCYQQNGQWIDSQEQINIQPDGSASATAGQHQAYFPVDIGSGVIKIVTPDGLTLQSQPVALSYDDGTNTVLIAELTNSVGQLISSNQIIYTNAFIGVDADLLYTYRKSGFEQDVIFREQPLAPEQFGLDSDNTRLQLLTEFLDPPTPVESVGPVNLRDNLQDTTLAFGQTRMVHGRAFLTGTTSTVPNLNQVSVYKSWVVVNGRTFLIEELPFQRIEPQLATLPASTAGAVSSANSILHKVSATRLLPPVRLVAATTNTLRIAEAAFKKNPGVVFDYVTVNPAATNFVFQGDTTYYIDGDFYLIGTNTVEGGSVIKINGNDGGEVEIDASSSLICSTAPYRPAIFTSYNDDSVGDIIDISSGSPNWSDGYVSILLDTSGGITLHDLHFCYTFVAIYAWDSADFLNLWNSQCYDVCVPVFGNDNVGLYNDLFGVSADEVSGITGNGDAQVFVEGPQLIAENVTADSGFAFIEADDGSCSVALTNCLITSQPILSPYGATVTLSTNDVVYLPSPSQPVYQMANGGGYYLTNGSPYHDAGTTNIDPCLLTNLTLKTTYPPIVYDAANFTVPTTFSPQAQRDNTGTPDLGYHYDPLDYVFVNSCQAYTNLTFTAGTAAAWSTSEGIQLQAQFTVSFNGTATQPDYWVRCNTVQEQDSNGDYGPGGMASAYSSSLGTAPTAQATFTHFSMMAGFGNAFRDDGGCFNVNLQDCEFWDTGDGGYGVGFNATNCLFYRSYVNGQSDCNACMEITMQNCTVYGRSMLTSHWSGAIWPVYIVNCSLDGVDLSQVDSVSYADYNAYLTNADQLPSSGSHDVIVTDANGFNWQTSWFGSFYLPSDSPLIDMGSTNANYLGLYHFTTQTDQVPETNSIVDIGYHYVATDDNGNPLDSNGDGIPDYLEDANGNGLDDSGEIGWNLTNDLGLTVIISQPQSGSRLP